MRRHKNALLFVAIGALLIAALLFAIDLIAQNPDRSSSSGVVPIVAAITATIIILNSDGGKDER